MWLTKKGAHAAAKDAVETYYNTLSPKKQEEFLKDKFEDTWENHFDVLHEGKIDIHQAD